MVNAVLNFYRAGDWNRIFPPACRSTVGEPNVRKAENHYYSKSLGGGDEEGRGPKSTGRYGWMRRGNTQIISALKSV